MSESKPFMGDAIDLGRVLSKKADDVAKAEIQKFNDVVNEIVIEIEAVLHNHEATWGHWHSAVEAFNARNSMVIPELKMSAIKDMFIKLSETQDVRPIS